MSAGAAATSFEADREWHAVQFYDRDEFLIDEVASFVENALARGEAVVLIATPEHRAALAPRCQSAQLSRASTGDSSDLVALDARDTLAGFMVRGWPDEALFLGTVGALVKRASLGGARRVAAFGEMVALLVADGNAAGALELERLWNKLGAASPLSLLCAYPLRLFGSAEEIQSFRGVCAAHGTVRAARIPQLHADRSLDALTLAELQQRTLALQNEVERRREVERTLREREAELSDFLENGVEGLHRVGGDGTILWANRAELDMLGYTAEEYIGRNISQFYVDRGLIADILQRLSAGEVLYDQPAALRCKDGSIRHVLIHSNGHFENDKLVYTRCFTRDVTARHMLERIEHERNDLLMQAPVAAVLLDGPQHVIRLANRRFCELVGRDSLVGKACLAAFPSLRRSKLLGILDRAFATGDPFVAEEYPLRIRGDGAPEGQQRYFKFNIQPLRALSGSVYGMMAVAVDVTELVNGRRAVERVNIERASLLEELQRTSRAKDEFLAMLGHELRNPLAPIVTALQLMKMRGDVASSKEQAVIQRQVDHLVRLVDDLLDVSRITRGKVDLRKETVSISQVAVKAVEMASMLLEQRRHHLTIDVPAVGLVWHGDATRLAQVIANLLTNAARYTEPGGDIRLRARREGDEIVITVIDNGRGMEPELLARAFELFFQGQQRLDRAEGGLGIGLALVKNLVELHGGTVTARSEGLGKGCEVLVRLPIELPDSDAVAERPSLMADDAGGSGQRRRILIVDDNVDAADSLAAVLESRGHEVKVVYDPMAAIHLAAQFVPHWALLDIGLPVMDGYELVAQLRESLPADGSQFVALTGYGQSCDRERSASAGFHHHLVKPVGLDELLHLIEGGSTAP